ncbi:signal peptidase I [Anoxybacillus rupiensis]|uniref:Signal peptidase I n=1 Tax=Anoxybacteroides rupiense TaxID=311460 RepID=A0ABT5W8J8_9BACL|nr:MULTISPECIES: signal peptidase I [Anoxybacillus]MBB3907572.1 signal peptidase I [Anoxybacillus rupiensis]MBS2770559.1 signal peptidase I [Anoxybacillus rupiensis]MDE8565652.1 signal peptidase I [Anoxybacillus rupiensis]QHC03183.1 signal peptidase I [Anoxybacillus sp. PDR2]
MSKRPIYRRRSVIWTVSLTLVFFARFLLFTNYVVEGESMMPTLQDGNFLIVKKFGSIQRFDIIVFHANTQKDYVKRVIGLPGDRIMYKNDVLYINGKPIEEPYLQRYKRKLVNGKLTGDFTLQEVTGRKTVPPGYVFVLGDNRLVSWDSRHFGYVKMNRIVGKVNARCWPFREISIQF